MANVKISELPLADVLGGTEQVPVVQGGVTKRAPASALVGPAGPTGPQGPQGIQGPPGPPGTTTWAGITDKPPAFPPEVHSHTSAQIVDASTIGRSILMATDAASARAAIGAGTSSFSGAYADLTGKPTLGGAAALDVGTVAGTVAAGDDARLSDERTPTAAGIASKTHAAPGKSTPVDADELPLSDSASSWSLARLTWASIKATLKTYFDALYQAVLVSGTNIKTVNGTSLLGSGDLAVSASPAGSSGQLQYNNAGAFAGAPGSTYNPGTGFLTIRYLTISGSGNSFSCSGNGSFVGQLVAGNGFVSMTSDATYSYCGVSFSAHARTLFMRTGASKRAIVASASDTDLAGLTAASVRIGKAYTVSELPAASGCEGELFYCTDLTSTTSGSTASGGGALKGVVVSKGTAFIVVC